jgi:hypothetical protein
MPTKNPRVNVVLEPGLYDTVRKNAEKQGLSVSSLIRDIVRDACRDIEDLHWAKEGESRLETFDRKKAVSHKDAWK